MPAERARALVAPCIACALLLLAGAAWTDGDATHERSRAEAVDAIFSEYERKGSPGVAVGVYRNGEQIYAEGYGYAHLEHDVPITPQTVFHAASVSKQFVAFSAALLAAQGRLDLDGGIRQVLADVPDFGAPITPRHLIHHTSGLRDQWTLFVLGGMEMDNRLRQRQVLRMVERQRALNFAPGSDYTYSNTGYTLLAELVGAASGKSLRQYADSMIFKPLRMDSTLFYDDVTELVPDRAQSYERGDDGKWHRSLLNFDNVGATSLHTTVEDLLKWGGNFIRPVVGDEATIATFSRMGSLDDGTPIRYGFGLQERKIAGRRALWHSGSDAGFRSIFAVFPDDGLVVAILANSPLDLMVPLAEVGSIYLHPDEAAGSWRDSLPSEVWPASSDRDGLTGDYYFRRRPAIVLEKHGDGLVAKVVGEEDKPVTFREDGTFDFGDEERLSGIFYRPAYGPDGKVVGIEDRGSDIVEGRYPVYRRIARAQPTRRGLEEIAGRYYSPELDITYTLYLDERALYIESLWSAEPVRLYPTTLDRFEGEWPMHDIGVERDQQGRVTALSVSSERARDVMFSRLPEAAVQPTNVSHDLPRLLDELTATVPGISAAVATSGGVVWAGTAGWSDLEARQPVSEDHLFGIGSITKTFISVILHQLATEGRVDLDDTPASILGNELSGIANAGTATLRQLMNHTSGIPSWEDDPQWQSDGRGESLDPNHIWGKMETLRYIKGVPALFVPGEQYSYSNSNFTILGRVVEVITGNDLVDEIEARIRQPARLSSVYLEGFEPVPRRQLATRYHFNTAEFRNTAGISPAFSEAGENLLDVSATNLSVEWAAGGMVASAGNLARYGVAVFDGTLLSPDSLDDLQTFRPVRWSEPADSATDPEPLAEVGYGIFRVRAGDYEVLGHGGDVLGYSAWLYYEPVSGVALAILTNAGTMHAGPDVGVGADILKDGRFISAAIAAAGK